MATSILNRIPTYFESADADPFAEPVSTAFERVAAARGIPAPRMRRPERPTLEVVPEPEPEQPAHRPVKFSQVIGQGTVVMRLQTFLRSAVARGEQPAHVLIDGQPGTGKTTLGEATASELSSLGVPSRCIVVTGDSITSSRQLAVELARLQPGDCLLVDEAQALRPAVQVSFLKALEDRGVFIPGSSKLPAVEFELPPVTVLACTSNPGPLSAAFRSRFKLTLHLQRYDEDDLALMGMQYGERANLKLSCEGALVLARAARGVPRRMITLVDQARDYVFELTGRFDELIDEDCAGQSLEYNELTELGLDTRDVAYLETLAVRFAGGPIGLPAMCGALGAEVHELTTDVEPYLLELGAIDLRSTGRCATRRTFELIGLGPPPIINGYR